MCTHICAYMRTYTHTHPGELQGKSGISRNTLEKQEKAEDTRCKIVLNKKEREVEKKSETETKAKGKGQLVKL